MRCEDTPTDVIDLGDVTVETRGSGSGNHDTGGLPGKASGISDD